MHITSTNFGSSSMGRRLTVGMHAVFVALLVACGTKDAAGPLSPSGPTGRVRFVNMITDTTRGRVNAILEKVPFGVNMIFGAATPASLAAPSSAPYAPIYTGARTLVLKRTADTSVTVLTVPFTVTANVDQTIYATGGAAASAVTAVITTDVNTAPAATEVRFRVVNMLNGPVDVFFTASGADLAAATPNVTGLASKTASAYLTLAPASYQIRMVPAGTAPASRNANVLVNIAAAAYAGGAARTVIGATGADGGTPNRGFVFADR